MRQAAGALAAVLALTVIGYALYGAGHLGYDAAYSLVWGDDLLHGRGLDRGSDFAPTPHPLINALGAAISPLGTGAAAVYGVISLACFAALGVAAFALGRALFSTAVGIAVAALLLTRPPLVQGALYCSSDIPFIALVVAALAAEARRPRDGRVALACLAVAGLIRPEAWLLGGAYALYLLPARSTSRARALVVGAAVLAPAVWLLSDLLLTGDALVSLRGTRELAEQLERPRSATTAPLVLPSYLQALVGDAVALGGVLVTLVMIRFAPERVTLPLVALGLGIAGFLALGFAGLPLLARYTLLPAAVLALMCAAGLLHWREPGLDAGARRNWAIGAGVLALLIAADVPGVVTRLREARAQDRSRAGAQRALASLAADPELARRLPACRPLTAPNFRLVPLLARELGVRTETIEVATPDRIPEAGLVIVPASTRAGQSLVSASDSELPLIDPPDGFARVRVRSRDWALLERCPGS